MIPLLKPSISQQEIDNVTEVLKSGWWGQGAKTEEFEKRFAKLVGARFAVAVNSCTAALDLALKVNNLEDSINGEVIVPALTFVSTGLAALYNNCKVVFADIDEETLCIDWSDVEAKLTDNTQAIIPVHYAGAYAGYKPIHSLIIEDCAHAMGNPLAGEHMSCWSFHAVKNLACGDGGMITTEDEDKYHRLKALRWCGINKSTYERTEKKYGWDYDISEVGYKYHMNDIAAAIGLAQLDRLDSLNQKRKDIVAKYIIELEDLKWLKLPKYDNKSSWHLFVVRVEAGIRDRFIDYLLENGISAGVHYKPLNHYPMFPQTVLPVTDRVWKTLVTLPLFPDMTNEELLYIIDKVKKFK